MVKRILAAALTLALLFAPTAVATPVFDCTKPEIRQRYPAQCPQLPDPLLTGGGFGGGHVGGGSAGGDGGLLGTIGGLLGGLTGGLL